MISINGDHQYSCLECWQCLIMTAAPIWIDIHIHHAFLVSLVILTLS